MIQKFEYVPVTETSHPYATAAVKCRFPEVGYVEDEYFMHGTANVYAHHQGELMVAAADAPYVTRLLIRRPRDVKRFSGNVVVEILNATNFMDIDRVWVASREKLIRDGDIYVGISSKPTTVPVMQKLDPERYAPLSWKNPRKPRVPVELTASQAGALSSDTETGLFWDMLLELPGALKDASISPIKEYLPFYTYLAGWSQSGCYMVTFVNCFAYKDLKNIQEPIYDGYFSTGAVPSAAPGVNQEESIRASALVDPEVPGRLRKLYQPFIEIHTESENAHMGSFPTQTPDSDAEDFRYRAYDIPGASHDVKDNMIDYYALDPDLPKTGIFPGYGGMEPYPNDYPYNFIFHRALNMLFDWVRKGVKPPHVPRIQVDEKEDNVVDESGNAVGGWRTAFLEYPTCTYVPVSTPLKPDFAFGCGLFGHKKPFGAEELKKRYGSLAQYKKMVEDMADKQIREGMLEAADKDDYISMATGFAAEGGLQ